MPLRLHIRRYPNPKTLSKTPGTILSIIAVRMAFSNSLRKAGVNAPSLENVVGFSIFVFWTLDA